MTDAMIPERAGMIKSLTAATAFATVAWEKCEIGNKFSVWYKHNRYSLTKYTFDDNTKIAFSLSGIDSRDNPIEPSHIIFYFQTEEYNLLFGLYVAVLESLIKKN